MAFNVESKETERKFTQSDKKSHLIIIQNL
jgi:hypothetical protein